MIYFNFLLENPWFFAKEPNTPKNFLVKSGQLSTNKFWELQIAKWQADTILKLEVDLRWWGHDHAGPSFHIEILGWMLSASINDHRHWDKENDCWKSSQEETV